MRDLCPVAVRRGWVRRFAWGWGLSAFLVSLPQTAAAQVVLGQITDVMTGDPVREAEVLLVTEAGEVAARGLTNAQGHYAIRLQDGAILKLTVERIGYAAGDTVTLIVPEDNSAYLDLALRPEGLELPGIVITAKRLSSTLAKQGFYQRMEKNLGFFLTAEEIREAPGRQLPDLFRRIPGVQVRGGVPYVIRAQALSLRSSQGCAPALFLDGMPLRGPESFHMIPTDWITGIEFYKSSAGIPQEWRYRDEGCGLIALWTR